MNSETTITTIADLVNTIIADTENIFLVDLKITAGNSIKVFVDADEGLTIDKCTRINRSLYKQIKETGLFPDGNFALEVSSPGIDEPLKLLRQYKKNIGRTVEVTMHDETRKEGRLIDANDEGILIEEKEGKGKKAIAKQANILFNQIRHTKVLVTF